MHSTLLGSKKSIFSHNVLLQIESPSFKRPPPIDAPLFMIFCNKRPPLLNAPSNIRPPLLKGAFNRNKPPRGAFNKNKPTQYDDVDDDLDI